jgi:hypothetical protein
LNHNIDASVSTKHGSYIGNAATFYFLPIVLLASVVGLASTLVGFHHLRVWRTDSLAAAAAASLIAWLITLLAFGLACKEIHIGGHRSRKLKVVEAFTVILAVFELLYLMSLHAGILGGEYGPSYTNNNTSATATGPAASNNIAVSEKHLHGTAAAAAVWSSSSHRASQLQINPWYASSPSSSSFQFQYCQQIQLLPSSTTVAFNQIPLKQTKKQEFSDIL